MQTSRRSLALCTTLATVLAHASSADAADEIRYGITEKPWPIALGNHRARVHVTEKADAVRLHVPWRRRDPAPQDKAVVIQDAATGKTVTNVLPVQVNREFGDLVFQPQTAPGDYDVYFMPFTERRIQHQYDTTYAKGQPTADAAWLDRNGLSPDKLAEGKWRSLPEAKVIGIEARNDFHRFDPMEVVATAEETRQLIAQHPDRPYLLFPEDRLHAIRMTGDLPLRWIKTGPSTTFRGKACRGEFYVFQIGLYASRAGLNDLAVDFGPLKSPQGNEIPPTALRCFNLGGVDWLGKPFKKNVSVAKGKIQALWFGLQVPPSLPPGEYEGTLSIRTGGADPTPVLLVLSVSDETIKDAGDDDLNRLARLRWLDSTIGVDDEPTKPYAPLVVNDRTVSCLGRDVRFADTGLPEQIVSRYNDSVQVDAGGHGRNILAGTMTMAVETTHGNLPWTGGKLAIEQTAPGAATVSSQSQAGALTMTCRAKMEFDGYVNYRITLTANQPVETKDVVLEIPLLRDAARYMMGLGRKGGFRPDQWQWKWDINRANSSVWLGDVSAGLHCRLKTPADEWNIYNFAESGLPKAWSNDGKGGCNVEETGSGAVVIRAYSGPRKLQPGEELQYCFGLLITPVKPLSPDHWKQRYYHAYVPVEKAVEAGANIINIHHGNELNPNINYPFQPGPTQRLSTYVKQAHDKGVKVKLYYTVRELSNYVAEMWALRSLNHEVFTGGSGGGHSWLQEHLISDYSRAWHHMFDNGDVDAAIGQVGLSRWHNYYLEGLRWLVKNIGIDGIYLDGIGYNREIMKRVRRVMDRARPGCLIDFHSGNNFHPNYGLSNCANQYMEHFPYVDSTWFGEGFDYNETPDYWLVEISTLPFGVFGEMLQGGGNPWRGMIYGMTGRYYQGADPGRIWKVWDDFGIQDAEMIGYWAASCPVRTDCPNVLVTVYKKKGKALVSLASWAKDSVRCRLAIDWKALGLDPTKAKLYAPPIRAFQPAALYRPTDPIPVGPGRGWLLVLDELPHDLPQAVDAAKDLPVLFDERFSGDRLSPSWNTHLSKKPGTKLTVGNDRLVIDAKANCFAYAEHALPKGTTAVACRIFSGTDKGASWGPGLSVVWPGGKFLRINVRAEGRFGVDDGQGQWFGGFSVADGWHQVRIRVEGKEVLAECSMDGAMWEVVHRIPRDRLPGEPVAVRIGKMSNTDKDEDYQVLGPEGSCAIADVRAFGRIR
ncbi:MAG: hypothetical protein JXQ73_15490 [Phycisphaerae bacterium]|nr:hypothetical protein [Phycisphaerae bacterium]